MKRRHPLKVPFYISLTIVVLLIGYKAYLNLFAPEFEAEHTEQVAQIQDTLSDDGGFSFAVVGNINNSVGVFEERMIPALNQSGVDFVVSAGNAVSGGGEDKYRAIQGTLSQIGRASCRERV